MFDASLDSYFMQRALMEAEEALNKGEVPVGALLVCENQIIARLTIYRNT